MGAKSYLLIAALLAAAGCSGGLKRFAPPGILKYEDLAKDQPPNPAIVERIEAQKNAPGGGFPELAEQPTKLPEGIAKPERDAMIGELLLKRDILNAAVESDRDLAQAERADDLNEMRDALADAVAKDDAVARRERGLAPRETEPVEE